MDTQDMKLDDNPKASYLVWTCRKNGPNATTKFMIHWKPEGRTKQGCPLRTWKDGIYTAMNERDLRMGKWNNRRQGIWQSEGVVRRFKTAIYTYIYIYVYIFHVGFLLKTQRYKTLVTS
jgi:hypothetical protein